MTTKKSLDANIATYQEKRALLEATTAKEARLRAEQESRSPGTTASPLLGALILDASIERLTLEDEIRALEHALEPDVRRAEIAGGDVLARVCDPVALLDELDTHALEREQLENRLKELNDEDLNRMVSAEQARDLVAAQRAEKNLPAPPAFAIARSAYNGSPVFSDEPRQLLRTMLEHGPAPRNTAQIARLRQEANKDWASVALARAGAQEHAELEREFHKDAARRSKDPVPSSLIEESTAQASADREQLEKLAETERARFAADQG